MSVYLSVAPPDGFSRWGDAEWEKWLRELSAVPATAMQRSDQHFASAEDLATMVGAARARLGKEPSIGDVWADLLARIDVLLAKAIAQDRGIYFGNV